MLINADSRTIPLEDKSVQCAILSPPYYDMRDYGVAGEIGSEITVTEYVNSLLYVFRELRRVLRDDGTAWLNLGDCYAGSGSGAHYNSKQGKGTLYTKFFNRRLKPDNYKPKDLMGIPWNVASALRSDGWWLRDCIIWAKAVSYCPVYSGTTMPEAAKDRTVQSHEYIFVLSKSPRYFYDQAAMREPLSFERWSMSNHAGVSGKSIKYGGTEIKSKFGVGMEYGYYSATTGKPNFHANGRNPRSVWTINPARYVGTHYATFPPKLVEKMVQGGSSEAGCCSICGAPRVRMITRKPYLKHVPEKQSVESGRGVLADRCKHAPQSDTYFVGFRPSCVCGAKGIISERDLEQVEIPIDATGDPDAFSVITRYEYEQYQDQVAQSRYRSVMKRQAMREGEVTANLLDDWIERGWIDQVNLPEWEYPEAKPCIVLDPFVGSGTTVMVANRMKRIGIGIDLSLNYLVQNAKTRISGI